MQGICAITDPKLTPGEHLFEAVEQALSAGVEYIQYRDKFSSASEKLNNAKKLVSLCEQYKSHLIINDDIELAKNSHAHGVHLGQSDGEVKDARRVLGKTAIIGVTCHQSLDLAKTAEAQGANYCAFGAFFKSKTKPHAQIAPLSLIAEAKKSLSFPIVVIGGITLENMPQLIVQGASAIALCNSIFAAENIYQAAEDFHQSFKQNNELHIL